MNGCPNLTLCEPCPVHWDGVENDSQCSNPEVEVGQFHGVQLGVPHFWNEEVEHTESQEAIPAQSSNVYVRDGPVGKVADGVHALERHHWPLKRGHTVTSDRNHHEF